MNKDLSYKKDVILGTWVAIALFLLTGFVTLIEFEQLTTKRVEPTNDCDVCRWTNP